MTKIILPTLWRLHHHKMDVIIGSNGLQFYYEYDPIKYYIFTPTRPIYVCGVRPKVIEIDFSSTVQYIITSFQLLFYYYILVDFRLVTGRGVNSNIAIIIIILIIIYNHNDIIKYNSREAAIEGCYPEKTCAQHR